MMIYNVFIERMNLPDNYESFLIWLSYAMSCYHG